MSHVGGGQRDIEQQGWPLVLLAWLLVSVPLIWGIWQTVKKATALFR